MSLRAGIAFVLAASLLSWSSAQAQRPAQSPNQNADDGPRAHEFWPAAPEVGDLFPDVSVSDHEGNLVNIRELATENYSVFVLGCLT